ncbi:MAG: hypothetical protein LQ343_007712 [Gyalolechia ehrenbergii]|nr:MAG: hypothetical protein LQ343_007712 [Gyalolechia ehrenbergii]
MSALLWRAFFDDDVDQFRHLLANATYTTSSAHSKGGVGGSLAPYGTPATSPGTSLGTSPTLNHKGRRLGSGGLHGDVSAGGLNNAPSLILTRADVNCKDYNGCTLLHHIASSSSDDALYFANALLDVPILDLYSQDAESGWTALHRALYFGHVAIAQSLIERDVRDTLDHARSGGNFGATGLIKIKDREGNSPFDVYGASIARRELRHANDTPLLPGSLDDEENQNAVGVSGDSSDEEAQEKTLRPRICTSGDELFTFGSNKNFTLGFGDEDDRQFPERITLRRPEHLLRRLAKEHDNPNASPSQHLRRQSSTVAVPAVVQFRPIIIQDVRLAKLHSAILTTDPEANLYVCGFGPGGRLGTGDENTRFNFVPVSAGGLASRRIIDVGLGQNHTLAVTSKGEVFSWGSNVYGQLGYTAPTSAAKDEEPIQLLPKQIFGPLKREVVRGVATSRTHSVVYTLSSLFTFGKNDGQLGLVDSEARSLAIQNIPRRVAASLFQSVIDSVSAIDKASICLLDNHEVWIFANYGYTKLSFPLDSSRDLLKNHFLATRYNAVPCHICKITSGGDTICAMSNEGDVFTVSISQRMEEAPGNGSTTNPAKIRGALSVPQRVWTRRKGYMAVRDVDVGQDGSIIICTQAGSVWRRVKRAKVKDANAPLSTEYKPKDYKFSRIPGLTRVVAVRSNTFGAYAAIRGDCDVLQTQIDVNPRSLWKDLYPLVSFKDFALEEENSETENPRPRFWTPSLPSNDTSSILQAVLHTANVEESIANLLAEKDDTIKSSWDMHIGSTASDVHIPVHEIMLAGRSHQLRRAFLRFRDEYFFAIPRVISIEYDKNGQVLVLFHEVNFLTVFNFVLYVYTDSIADVWLQTRQPPPILSRYRQVRSELMHIAAHLEMRSLERSVRAQTRPGRSLHEDMDHALNEPQFLANGDVEIQLDGAGLNAHMPILCQRCPFFEGLFQGRAAGRWLSARRQQSRESISVDLKHVKPEVFKLVLRHIYADAGEEIFDHVCSSDLESFLDLVIEVMSVANELMLDRLSQCCQLILGKYVNTRNVCQLLNAVAPCSVTEFKRVALEYICLNLEGMLENHLLTELDEDLLLELDDAVKQNQLARLPISRSGRANIELLETYPQLAEIIERGKRIKVDRISFQSRWRHDDVLAKSVATKAGFVFANEGSDRSPFVHKSARKSSSDQTSQGKDPFLKMKKSVTDLMFDMDMNEEIVTGSQRQQTLEATLEDQSVHDSQHTPQSLAAESPWLGTRESGPFADVAASPLALDKAGPPINLPYSDAPRPWGVRALSSQKLEMKDIMAQASANKVSSLSTNLSSQAPKLATSSASKLSQRERKKQQQQAAWQKPQDMPYPPFTEAIEVAKPNSPWQVASRGAKTSLKEILGPDSKSPSGSKTSAPLTLRQTLPGKTSAVKRTASENTSQAQPTPPHRSTSTPLVPPATNTPPRPSSSRTIPYPSSAGPSGTPTKSIRYTNAHPTAEPSLQLSMADILSQQQTEKDVFKEAAAKRSLQEIQEEQAFQEWWDEESRKVMEEEAAASAAASRRSEGRSRPRGRRKSETRSSGGGKSSKVGETGREGSGVGRENGDGRRGAARGRGKGTTSG